MEILVYEDYYLGYRWWWWWWDSLRPPDQQIFSGWSLMRWFKPQFSVLINQFRYAGRMKKWINYHPAEPLDSSSFVLLFHGLWLLPPNLFPAWKVSVSFLNTLANLFLHLTPLNVCLFLIQKICLFMYQRVKLQEVVQGHKWHCLPSRTPDALSKGRRNQPEKHVILLLV